MCACEEACKALETMSRAASFALVVRLKSTEVRARCGAVASRNRGVEPVHAWVGHEESGTTPAGVPFEVGHCYCF